MSDLTIDQFRRVVPKHLRNNVTEDLINKFNNCVLDEEFRESVRETILGYTTVLQDGKFKLQDYINACKYVSFKLMGNSNYDSYVKTFPDRYQRLIGEGSSVDKISAYVSAYNKRVLVNRILEQTLIPTYVLNAEIHQKAINVQADLMMNAKSEKVRTDAANSLLNHLKQPEKKQIEVDIGIKETDSIKELREATTALAKQQKEMIAENVMSAKEIAESKIIEGELIE